MALTIENFSSIFHGIVKKPATISLSPPVWVPKENNHFPVEENHLLSFFLVFLLGFPISVNDCDLIEVPL